MAPAAAGSRGARGRLLILTFVLASALGAGADARAAVPASWPFGKVEVGVHDPENAAASLRQRGPYGLRYHYLSGGVNTGQGWRTWAEGNGSFVPKYVADSAASGFPATVFSYYQLYQSAPASGSGDEREAMLANLRNVDTMRAYYDDLETFFRRAAVSPAARPSSSTSSPTRGATCRRPAVPRLRPSPPRSHPPVARTWRGSPDNATGFAQAIVRLRNAYAPNVLLGYHLSPWGSGIDPALSTHLNNERIDTAAAHSAAFHSSLGSSFDLVFAEYTNRDAGYMRVVDGFGPEADWTDEDFNWHARFIGDFARAVGRSVVMWQIPFGNTLMRAMNDTPFHYQDNKVERLLGDRQRHRDEALHQRRGDRVPLRHRDRPDDLRLRRRRRRHHRPASDQRQRRALRERRRRRRLLPPDRARVVRGAPAGALRREGERDREGGKGRPRRACRDPAALHQQRRLAGEAHPHRRAQG